MGVRVVAGVAALVVGLIWIFQGLGAIDGYGMSGHGEWVLFGGILAIFGVALLVGARRTSRPRD
jgi:pheromone shutdown protein TraB